MKKNSKFLSGAKQGLFALALSVFSGTAYSQVTYTFNYTGSSQTISLPAGNYSIACWGADGGTVAANTATPGRGGYSSGDFTLNATTTFSIYVGGKGNGGAQPLGGFNSGNTTTKTNSATATGGGGASDVRVLNDNFFHRIIVAGGGGGQGTSTGTGGHGGGLTGQNGQGTSVNIGIAGTQTSAGVYPGGGDAKAATFGEGGDGPAGTTGGQGGGGWYGGSFGTRTNGGGAGGSGYVLTSSSYSPVGYFAANPSYYFTNTVSAMPGAIGFVSNPDVTGNGKVFITELCSITLSTSVSGTANAAICSGQSLTLTTNAVSNYSWSTGATTSSLVVSPATTTVYALTAMSPSNCTATKAITVTVSAGLPTVGITASSLQVCPGQSVILTATGATSYTWAGITNGVAFAPTTTSLYVVSGANGCGTSTAGITITVSPLPVSVVSTNSAVCSNKTATLMATAAATVYNWQPGVPSTASTAIVSPSVNTIYTVTASDGTCSGTATVSLISNPVPTLASAASPATICAGQSSTLTASGALNYTWTSGVPGSGSLIVSPQTTTVYSVVGENTFGCSVNIQQAVLVNPQPTLVVNASNNPICAGATSTITVSGANNYQWGGGPSSNSIVITPTQTTIYNVAGTLVPTGCSSSASITINVFNPVMSISGNNTICTGGSASLAANAPGAGTSYIWNPGNQQVQTLVVSPVSNSVYSVSAISSSNTLNCPVDGTIIVTVNPNPTLTTTFPSSICIGDSRVISASGASSYTWNLLGATVGTSSSVTASSPVPGFLSYSVTGANSFGCKAIKPVLIIVYVCTGIENVSVANNLLRVYPNPNEGHFFISSASESQLNIVDEIGRQIQEVHLNEQNGFTAEIQGLANGVYFIHSKDSHQRINLRIVVLK